MAVPNNRTSLEPDFLRRAINKYELDHVWPKFEAKLGDLFLAEEENCRVGIAQIVPPLPQAIAGDPVSSGERSSLEWVSTASRLQAVLECKMLSNARRMIILHRLNSWSRMSLTSGMFQAICRTSLLTPRFLKISMGMGRKLSSGDEHFMACYSSFSIPEGQQKSREEGNGEDDKREGDRASELCYNLRHFELHGRDLEDPWSCRQSALHFKYCHDTRQSSFIIIQPPTAFGFGPSDWQPCEISHPMNIHLRYIAAATQGWREYLDYMSEKLKKFDDQIAISKPYGQFQIGFSCLQKIHNIRRKLHHANSILANTTRVLAVIQKHEDTLAQKSTTPASIHDNFQRELHSISGEVASHLETTQKLLNLSNDIRSMYKDILELHKQELLHSNGMKLAQIAQADSTETGVMVSLADKTAQDSRTMRIATVVAMFYLPANLVMSFFSTTLVWFQDDAVLRVHPEVWIIVVATILLAICTICTSICWGEREKRLDEKCKGLNRHRDRYYRHKG
ncbi:hypothetical protein GQ53DRAFT_838316 [Thozetella sp. PMI_491]|nr:hypothetical protein GQ53DRAFT_838316 [Thozetella sp. PMI_491]